MLSTVVIFIAKTTEVCDGYHTPQQERMSPRWRPAGRWPTPIRNFLVDLGMPKDADIYYYAALVLAHRKPATAAAVIDRQQTAAHPPRTKNHSTTKDRRCLRQPAGPAAFFRRWLLGDHDPTNLLENTSCPALSKRGASRTKRRGRIPCLLLHRPGPGKSSTP